VTECPNCHELANTVYCRSCGREICEKCAEDWRGAPHCAACAERLRAGAAEAERAEAERAAERAEPQPDAVPPPKPPPPPPPRPSADPGGPQPVLAALLGFVPGLGAVYNGQYVKGFLHVLLFGLLLTIMTNSHGPAVPLLAPLLGLFVLYMVIEAARTAQAIRRGQPVEELSGLTGALFSSRGRSPAAGVTLIAIGVFLLLFTLEILNFDDMLPFWPLLLVALGVWQLYQAIRQRSESAAALPRAEERQAATER